jgi:hypothetical protein
MTAVTRPRGRLPARVYWTRRLLVALLALGLVFGIARLLGGGGPASGSATQPVGADESTSTAVSPTSSPAPTGAPSPVATSSPSSGPTGRGGAVSTPLAQPTGPCPNSDIVAVPSVKTPAYAGRAVVVTVTLTTKASPACSWTVSAASLVVKVTSGADRIWSTQDCTGAVPRREVVLRRDTPVSVTVGWSGLRSDADCTRTTSWVETGYYHAAAAAFGADPTDVQFRLLPPTPATVTATPTPDRTSAGPDPSRTSTSGPGASATPATTPATAPTTGGPRNR